jgi:nitroreductase
LRLSWANKQCYKYVVVRDKAKIQELAGGYNGWLKKAPVVLAACADPKESGSHDCMDYYLVDGGHFDAELVLAATYLGLGTCWIGGFEESKIKRILMVPGKIGAVALTPVGYPADASLRSKITKTIV